MSESQEIENVKLRIMAEVAMTINKIYKKINETDQDIQQEKAFRELLENSFDSFVKKMDSKVEDCQTVSSTMLQLGQENKERINGMNGSIGEFSGYAAQALNKSKKTDNKFNTLWLRIFFSIIGSTLLSNLIGRFI